MPVIRLTQVLDTYLFIYTE